SRSAVPSWITWKYTSCLPPVLYAAIGSLLAIGNDRVRACSGGKREIRVELLRGGSYVICQVQDNGSPPRSVVPGRGLKIVQELVKTLNGNLKHKFGSHGTISLLAFPYSDGAQ